MLKAVLGLTACHLATQQPTPNRRLNTAALEYRVAALQSLSAILLKEECFSLNEAEEETALAIVLMLVLHDVSTRGILLPATNFYEDFRMRSIEPRSAFERRSLFMFAPR